jgi:hypothetical protein
VGNFFYNARMRAILLLLSCVCLSIHADPPATQATDKLPFIHVDVAKKQVRVDCENIGCEAPLEFFAVCAGGPEHEAMLRSRAKPSNIHLALLMLGLEPGTPIKYSEAAQKWFPPHGPPIHLTVEFVKDGKTVSIPAYRLVRDIHSKKEMPATTWIFAGSRNLQDGTYGADAAGYLVNIVNFDLAMIDVPALVSNSNETLMWEAANNLLPPPNSPVTLVIEPTDKLAAPKEIETGPTTKPAEGRVEMDREKLDHLQKLWEEKVAPHDRAIREAAQAQYDVMRELRREQQRLIDEADRIQRLIDELEKKYQDMTTPRPEKLDANE